MGKKIGFGKQRQDLESDIDKKEPDNEKKVDPIVYELLDDFCSKYLPALDIDGSTHQFTTAEIINAIKSFSQDSKLSQKHITDALLLKQYKFSVIKEGSRLIFKWIVREKL